MRRHSGSLGVWNRPTRGDPKQDRSDVACRRPDESGKLATTKTAKERGQHASRVSVLPTARIGARCGGAVFYAVCLVRDPIHPVRTFRDFGRLSESQTSAIENRIRAPRIPHPQEPRTGVSAVEFINQQTPRNPTVSVLSRALRPHESGPSAKDFAAPSVSAVTQCQRTPTRKWAFCEGLCCTKCVSGDTVPACTKIAFWCRGRVPLQTNGLRLPAARRWVIYPRRSTLGSARQRRAGRSVPPERTSGKGNANHGKPSKGKGLIGLVLRASGPYARVRRSLAGEGGRLSETRMDGRRRGPPFGFFWDVRAGPRKNAPAGRRVGVGIFLGGFIH